jgi:hypothetical protein
MATFDPALYEAARRNILNQFAQQSALNAYQRYLAQTRGQRPITQLEERAFGGTTAGALGEVPRLTSRFARSGLQTQGVRSGIYKQALQNFAKQRERELGYAREDLASGLRGYDLTGTGYQQQLETGMTDLESQKARQMAEDARQLLNLNLR